MNLNDAELIQRIQDDLIDSLDEELELELEDSHLDAISGSDANNNKEYRRVYFKELFRLQAELVKLQDWVAATGHKVVIIFEGRDAAGKGGVIKRITQRLNPRTFAAWLLCRRPMSVSARNGIFSVMCHICQPLAKWYCLTAAGTTARVLSVSWGFVTMNNMKNFSAQCPILKECWCVQAFKSLNTGFQYRMKSNICAF